MSEKVSHMMTSLQEKEMLDRAVGLFVRDHVTEAYPLFEELAKEGNPRALYFLGEYHRSGWAGLPENEEMGFQYHHQGAEKGEVLCQLNLAYERKTTQEDIVQAVIPKLLPLAEAGDVVAQDELGDALSNLNHLEDPSLCHLDAAKEAEHWLRRAAEAGYWRAMDDLACAYEGDRNIRKDLDKAIEWYWILVQMHGDHVTDALEGIAFAYHVQGKYDEKFQFGSKLAAEGCDWGMFYVAEGYEEGKGVTEDQEKAIEWFQKAYDCHGDAAGYAALRLGHIYYHRQEDMGKAFAWYGRCAEEGLGWGMYYVGNCYRDGTGVAQNMKKAMEWYRQAYELHSAGAGEAANQLGLFYSSEENDREAFAWYNKGAEEGDEWAMSNLAEMYRAGEGVSEDLDTAMKWYEKVYDLHGERAGWAANYIGVLYGDHKEEPKTAFTWFLRGAEEGFDCAMTNLGNLYQYGKGVEKDEDKAIEWYEKAYELHAGDAGYAADRISGIYEEQGNTEKKLEWEEKSAEEGFAGAMIGMGLRYDGEDASSADLERA